MSLSHYLNSKVVLLPLGGLVQLWSVQGCPSVLPIAVYFSPSSQLFSLAGLIYAVHLF